MDQTTLFGETEPIRPINGRSAQRLFVPKLLSQSALDFDKRTPERDRAYEIIKKWAALEASGKLRRMKETNLEGEFFADVFSTALGYTIFSQNLAQWDLWAKYPVLGQIADGAIGCFRHEGSDPPKVVIELKGPKSNIDRDRPGGRTPVQQCWDYLNLLPQCPWGLVCNYVSFRLYHRTKTPRAYEEFHLADLTNVNKFREFYYLFERGGFLPSLIGQAPRCDELLRRSENQQQEVGNKLYRFYHEQRVSLINYLRRSPHEQSTDDAIYIAQKLLDRVIFIAFCQYRLLLPEATLERAWRDVPAFTLVTNPRWENFKHLFRSIDKGNPAANISAFNGGLFETDPKVDDLHLDDQWTTFFREIGTYDFKDEVSVDVLGHLFEQSITDLEALRSDPDAAPAPEKKKTAGKRKREGVYYTPAFITQFIVRETIGPCLREKFAQLAEKLAVDPFARVEDRDPNKWRAYQLGRWEILSKLRVCDPACGSGAFLIQALDYLDDWYADVVGELSVFDDIDVDAWEAKINPTILRENLFGVDLSPEAVEITALSLWIRTAERGKTLADLSHNIQCGNSVVADPAVHPKAFDWQAAFPEVFSSGGFDVVIGNPPYVRQERLSDIKPYLQEHYATFHGMADLYVYFYELGIRRLRPGGWLSFIVTNKWMKAGYGEPLRRFFSEQAWMESVVDFGHAKQIFEEADVFPSIIVARKPTAQPKPIRAKLCTIPREQLRIDDLSRQIGAEGVELPLAQLGADPWQLEPGGVTTLMRKITSAGVPLTEFTGKERYRGVTTGLNDAFLIDTATKERIVRDDPRSAEIIKPYVRGQDIERWTVDNSGQWMIFARRGIKIDEYPGAKRHLSQFRTQLEPKPDGYKGADWPGRKPGNYKWYELQDPIEFFQEFERPKIFYQEIQFHPAYAYDDQMLYGNNKTSFIVTDDLYLLAVLNSPLMWWHTWRFLPHMKDEALAPVGYLVATLPIARPSQRIRKDAETHVRKMIDITNAKRAMRRTILDWLRVEHEIEKPSVKLQAPAELDSDAMVAEVKRIRGKKSPLSAAALKSLRDEYTRIVEPARLRASEVLQLERRLSNLINEAYGLTPTEVALMWETAPPRMPFTPVAS